MLRPLEDVLALLTSAGFTGEDALHIYRVLFGYLYGHILNELQEVIERPEETDDVLRLGLHRLAITEFPQLRELAPALASYDGAAELDRFLDLLLPGMTATLTGRDGQPAAVDGDQAPTSRPRPAAVWWSPHGSATCIAVKRQNIAKWPPRRHGGYLAKDRGFADADQKLRHSCASGQGGDEVAAGP
jgi:hypothetical protein